MASPSGLSTLITSAPHSAMIIAHPGAAIQVDISTTFNPSSNMPASSTFLPVL